MHPPETEPSDRIGLLQRASPRFKLLAAIILITATALLPRRPHILYLVPALALLLLWPLSRMPLSYIWRRLLVVELLVLGIASLSLINPAATPMVLAAIIKSNLCIFTLLMLTWTTPFYDILQELRRFRLPTVMLTILTLMYRYLPVLVEESRRMQRARASRTFSPRRRLAWQNLSTIIGQLFIRSAERAERIYLAMCARGWK
ncbi:MAG TPA: energy-coupling factor transporter transmembrane component T [Candidatus Limnocylindrales bacterium]|jgi:cobalt/nickel transport system permease protein|nr:energy-coupling factor transporter transmembrane component T [Candidatus Limnocylindrales bacterium]